MKQNILPTLIIVMLASCNNKIESDNNKMDLSDYSELVEIQTYYSNRLEFTPLEYEKVSKAVYHIPKNFYGPVKVWLDSNCRAKLEETDFHSPSPPDYWVRLIRDIVTNEKYYWESDKRRYWLYDSAGVVIYHSPSHHYPIVFADGVLYIGNPTDYFIYNPKIKKAVCIKTHKGAEFPRRNCYPVKNGFVILANKKLCLYRFDWYN